MPACLRSRRGRHLQNRCGRRTLLHHAQLHHARRRAARTLGLPSRKDRAQLPRYASWAYVTPIPEIRLTPPAFG